MSFSVIDLIIRIILVTVAAILFGVIVLTYNRIRNRKLLFISIGFGILLIHSLITIPELLLNAVVINVNLDITLDTITLVFVLIGILKD